MTTIKLVCKNCGKDFEVEYFNRKHKYCSAECYHNSGLKGKPPTKERKKCIVCGNNIPLVNERFCSIECRAIYWTGKERNVLKFVPEERKCPICDNIFLVGGKGNKSKSSVYCSTKCRGISQQKDILDSKEPTRSRAWNRLRDEILQERGTKCEFCDSHDAIKRIQSHHIIPIKYGGSHDRANLMLLDLKCHVILDHITNVGYEHNPNFNPKEMIIKLKEMIYATQTPFFLDS